MCVLSKNGVGTDETHLLVLRDKNVSGNETIIYTTSIINRGGEDAYMLFPIPCIYKEHVKFRMLEDPSKLDEVFDTVQTADQPEPPRSNMGKKAQKVGDLTYHLLEPCDLFQFMQETGSPITSDDCAELVGSSQVDGNPFLWVACLVPSYTSIRTQPIVVSYMTELGTRMFWPTVDLHGSEGYRNKVVRSFNLAYGHWREFDVYGNLGKVTLKFTDDPEPSDIFYNGRLWHGLQSNGNVVLDLAERGIRNNRNMNNVSIL